MPPFLPTLKIRQTLCNGRPAFDWALDGYLSTRQVLMTKRGWTKDWTTDWTKELDLGSSIQFPLDLTTDADAHPPLSSSGVRCETNVPSKDSTPFEIARSTSVSSTEQIQIPPRRTRRVDANPSKKRKLNSTQSKAVYSQPTSKGPRLQNREIGAKVGEEVPRRVMTISSARRWNLRRSDERYK